MKICASPKCLAYAGAIAALLTSSALAGPLGRYYVTDESGNNKVWQFQGSSLSSFPTTTGGADGPIVVDGNTNRVRTVTGGFSGGAIVSGSEYDFNGVVQGPVSLNFSAHGGAGRVIDAAFDGNNSYIVSGFGGGSSGVYQYNADFSGPGALLFDPTATGGAIAPQGITYDTLNNTLWISEYDFNATTLGGRVIEFTVAGVPTGNFFHVVGTDPAGNPVASERNTALAYDFSDDTFWMNAHVENTLGFGIGELWQFDRNGNFLQAIHGKQFDPNAPASILYWGGEILATGAPPSLPETGSTLALLGLVLAGFIGLRRCWAQA